MNKLKRRRGITLIELIIALGILAIITSLVFSFFFSNKKIINKVQIKSDLQYEAKVIMDKLSVVSMEATNGKVNDTSRNKIIAFDVLDSSGRSVIEDGIIFKFYDNNVILSEVGTPEIELCKTEDVEISVDATVIDKQGIKLKLTLEKKDVTYSVEDSFIFRNSHID